MKPQVKNQFLMTKTNADAPINGYAGGSLDYETTQSFYHSITKNSQQKIAETTVANPKIDALSAEVFKPTAKREDQCWANEKYRDSHHREQLMTTTDRGAQSNFDTEMMEKLRTSKHNIQRTIISEYSNAKNRGTVFTAPKFSSC